MIILTIVETTNYLFWACGMPERQSESVKALVLAPDVSNIIIPLPFE